MGNEYEIRISTMDQALIEEHIQSLPYLKVFNAERNEFELKDSEGGFAYIGIHDASLYLPMCNAIQRLLR
jgi:hypothetical protein